MWYVIVPHNATPGIHQTPIDVRRNGTIVGRVVITVAIMDLDDANVETLQPPPVTQGALQLLQVAKNDWVMVL